MIMGGGRCLDLSQDAAREVGIAGAKAAGLAAATVAGVKTLPGVVVPVGESAPVVRAALAALTADGVTAARLAAMKVHPDAQLVDEVRGRMPPGSSPWIVRSSSPLEGDGTWSGAFSTFHQVDLPDLATAVRACWGSAFQVEVLERARHAGTDPARLGLAVLVQPEVPPGLGGTARRRADGSVEVTATRGPLEPLMAGHVTGTVTVVGPDDSTTGGDLEPALLLEVASVSRRVHAVLGHRLVEWAVAGGRVHLLQSTCSSEPVAGPEPLPRADAALASPAAVRVAELTQRFPGRLGHELVLPWAVAADSLPPPADVPRNADPVAVLREVRGLAGRLTATVWAHAPLTAAPLTAAARADRTLRALRGDAPGAAVAVLQGLTRPGRDDAARLLGDLELLRGVLRSAGRVGSDATFWRLGSEDLGRVLRGADRPAPARLGVDQWEPFAYTVVMAAGSRVRGTPAAPGTGVGPVYVIGGEPAAPVLPGRYVLFADRPVPALAPLLWNAAGLVTRSGSPAAHLTELARSIGVPVVMGCALPALESPGVRPLVAADGTHGTVSVVWPS